MKTKLLAAALVLGFAALSPAQAAPDTQTAHIDVPYGDLNLASPAGAEVMLKRIKAAALKVCGGKPDIRDRQATRFYNHCVNLAVAQAVARLNKPVVTAIFNGRDPRFAQGPNNR